MRKIYSIDTSVILHNWKIPFILSENGKNKILISEIVLQELDNFKHGVDEKNYNAREFARRLSEGSIRIIDGAAVVKTNDAFIYLVKNTITNGCNDDKIIGDSINFLKEKHNNFKLKFVSNDIIFRLKCISKGFECEPVNDDNFSTDISFELNKYIDVLIPNNLDFTKSKLESILNEEIPNHISTVILTDKTGNKFFFNRIDKNTFIRMSNRDQVRILNFTAKNLEQKLLWRHLLFSKDDITVIEGIAGTSKTLSALLAAIKLLETNNKYGKITYIRKTIIAGDKLDEIGFLPGELKSKMLGYLYPLKDNIELIIRNKNKKKKKWTYEELEKAIEDFENKYNINYEYMGHLRGRNLSGIIIIDECQNLSIDNLTTILSRITDNSKVIITGSIKQIDNPYLNKYNNALTFMLNKCGHFNDVQVQGFRLNKVERGKITNWIENITK